MLHKFWIFLLSHWFEFYYISHTFVFKAVVYLGTFSRASNEDLKGYEMIKGH